MGNAKKTAFAQFQGIMEWDPRVDPTPLCLRVVLRVVHESQPIFYWF
jgi:hypothetical protein